jgi:hypothetical protein
MKRSPKNTQKSRQQWAWKLFVWVGLGIVTVFVIAMVTLAVVSAVNARKAQAQYKAAVARCGTKPAVITSGTDLESVQKYTIILPTAESYGRTAGKYSVFYWDSVYAYVCSEQDAKALLVQRHIFTSSNVSDPLEGPTVFR